VERGPSGVPAGGPLSLKETKALANLFALRAGVLPSVAQQQPGFFGGRKPGMPGAMGGAPGMGFGGAGANAYRPPFQFVEVVPIDVAASAFDIKKRCVIFTVSQLYLSNYVASIVFSASTAHTSRT
jgi:hypothetical protein